MLWRASACPKTASPTRHRHRAKGRAMSAAVVEALAAAHMLGAGIAVSKHDVGPNLRAATKADGISFRAL